MKSVFVLASLAAAALAQRLHIAEPTTGQNVGTGQYFTAELHMDVRRIYARFNLNRLSLS